MRTLRTALAAALVAGGLAAPVALADGPSPSGADAVAQCYAAAGDGDKACRSLQQGTWDATAACDVAVDPEVCGRLDGRPVSEQRVQEFEGSWTHRALIRQEALGHDAPLWENQLPHTHNSFNSSAYAPPDRNPTLTNQDANQPYSLTDQLRMGVRAIELDVHWVPSPYGNPGTGGYWVTLCHGDGAVGCSWDRPFESGLAEVRAWLDANPNEFLLLYLENQLGGNEQAHAIAAGLIEHYLGALVSRPATSCGPAPYDESPAQLEQHGARVLIVGNCGPGAWGSWVHERYPGWDESGNPSPYACSADVSKHDAHVFRRYYEESVWLAAMTDTSAFIDAPTTAQMVRCGVNIIGLDQLTPEDPRLPALVWSWAPQEPRAGAGACAYQRADSRFAAAGCTEHRAFACATGTTGWHVTAATGPWWAGFDACGTEFPGSTYSVPPNGLRNAELATAAGGREVWLDYRRDSGGTWVPHAAKPRGRPF